MADVYDFDGQVLAKNIRMVIIKGSEAGKKLKKLNKGERLSVLGTPRINLNEISKKLENPPPGNNLVRCTLPYEMVIISVLDD